MFLTETSRIENMMVFSEETIANVGMDFISSFTQIMNESLENGSLIEFESIEEESNVAEILEDLKGTIAEKFSDKTWKDSIIKAAALSAAIGGAIMTTASFVNKYALKTSVGGSAVVGTYVGGLGGAAIGAVIGVGIALIVKLIAGLIWLIGKYIQVAGRVNTVLIARMTVAKDFTEAKNIAYKAEKWNETVIKLTAKIPVEKSKEKLKPLTDKVSELISDIKSKVSSKKDSE